MKSNNENILSLNNSIGSTEAIAEGNSLYKVIDNYELAFLNASLEILNLNNLKEARNQNWNSQQALEPAKLALNTIVTAHYALVQSYLQYSIINESKNPELIKANIENIEQNINTVNTVISELSTLKDDTDLQQLYTKINSPKKITLEKIENKNDLDLSEKDIFINLSTDNKELSDDQKNIKFNAMFYNNEHSYNESIKVINKPKHYNKPLSESDDKKQNLCFFEEQEQQNSSSSTPSLS